MHIQKYNNIELYKLTDSGNWADFMFSEKYQSGRLTIASSFGTWSYYWPSCGKDFKGFLAEADIYYVAGKFNCADEFDFDKTIKHFTQNIEAIFEDNSAKKASLLADLKELSDCANRSEFYIKLGEYSILNNIVEYYELHTQNCISKNFEEFWRVFWQPFFAEFKNECPIIS